MFHSTNGISKPYHTWLGLHKLSSSGGKAIFFSCANFLSAVYLDLRRSTSSRIRMLSSFISSMSFHSCKDSSIINFWLAQRSYIDYLRFFRFQFVFLLDSFDATGSGVASVLQRSSSLLHANDFIPIQSAKFERSIQVTDGDGNKFLIADIRKRARWERSLKWVSGIDYCLATSFRKMIQITWFQWFADMY